MKRILFGIMLLAFTHQTTTKTCSPQAGICEQDTEGLFCCPSGQRCNPASKQCVDINAAQTKDRKYNNIQQFLDKFLRRRVSDAVCPDQKHWCKGDNVTCCELEQKGEYGCCPYANAVCCSDHKNCCPQRSTCDVAAGTCV